MRIITTAARPAPDRCRRCSTAWSDRGESSEALGATGVCFCCKTAILGPAASDIGGPATRDMVLAWRHIFPNSERDIAMSVASTRPTGGRAG